MEVEKLKEELTKKEKAVKAAAIWFYIIAGLSVIFSIEVVYSQRGDSVPSGITQMVNSIFYESTVALKLIGFISNLFVAGIFVIIGYLSRKLNKQALIMGMILYALDGLLLLIFQGFWALGLHLLVLLMINRGYEKIKLAQELKLNIKKQTEEMESNELSDEITKIKEIDRRTGI